MLARITAFLDRPESLVHARPHSLARAREIHHERANRHAIPLFRCLRLAWGYGWLIFVASPLRFLEAVTATPLRTVSAVILAVVIWHWS